MLGKERARKILNEALGYSTADEAEVFITGGKNWLTRFANNYIHQNVLQKDYSITAKLIKGKKIGIASCNVFHDEELKEVIFKAEEVLKNQMDEQEIIPVSSPGDFLEMKDVYDEKTINFTPEESSISIEKVINKCKNHNLIAAGTLSYGDHLVTYMNSRGNFAYHSSTLSAFTLTTINDEDGTGWSEDSRTSIDEIDVEKLTEIAIEKALLNKKPVELTPGIYTVILEEKAVASLLMFLNYLGFGSLSYQEGRSFMAGKIGELITGSNITIEDNAYRKETLGFPFDFEGMARQKVTLIENGIAKNVVYDMKRAAKEGKTSTGHALPPPSISGPICFNVILLPGNVKKEDIIANTEKAILITRFWYDNVVDPKKTIVTGLCRDGTFLVENGKITKAVKNMRYNNSILDVFSKVSHISDTLQSFAKYGVSLACPAMKIEEFNFSGISA